MTKAFAALLFWSVLISLVVAFLMDMHSTGFTHLLAYMIGVVLGAAATIASKYR